QVLPASGVQGATQRVTLSGDGFVAGSTDMFFSDEGITVLKVDVTGSTSAVATIVLSGTVGEKQTLVRTPTGLSRPIFFTITPNLLSDATEYRTDRFAGTDSGFGRLDGIGQAARFREPRGMWSNGIDLYVADHLNSTIRKIRLDTGEVTTVAGEAGEAAVVDGVGSAARFYYPQSVWGDGTFLYVAEIRRIRRIRIADGQVTTFAGPGVETTGRSDDGIGDQATFQYIRGIWGQGTRLFVSDLTTIRTVDLTTREVRTIAGDPRIEGYVDGTGMSARFRDIGAIWGDGVNIYAGDRGFVRKLAIATNEVTTFAEVESPDGIWGGGGRLYVIDVSGEKLKEFDLSTGQTRDLISPFPRPTGTTLPRPFHGIWTGGSGDVYLADPYTHVIRKMNVLSGEMTIIAGKPLEVSFRDGILSEARFSGPAGIWGDGENLYLADAGNHVIRKIDLENRIVSTIAGNPNAAGNEDGVGSAARFDSPSGIWGNGSELYVTDPVNDNVRRISLRTGEVTTVAVATRPSGLSGNGQRFFSSMDWATSLLMIRLLKPPPP
ncbi:MAG: hypothetical protein HY646_00070, partial [Acidobacteria bacterium]|nr:hypothetical protein [Acidobacteriota bacterium]